MEVKARENFQAVALVRELSETEREIEGERARGREGGRESWIVKVAS